MTARKNMQYEDYSFSKGKLKELQTIKSNVEKILETGKENHVGLSQDHAK